jgi:hypothetical protein
MNYRYFYPHCESRQYLNTCIKKKLPGSSYKIGFDNIVTPNKKWKFDLYQYLNNFSTKSRFRLRHFLSRVGIHRTNFISWINKIVIDSRVLIVDLPTNIVSGNLYHFFLAGNEIVSSLFDCLGKCGNAWKL